MIRSSEVDKEILEKVLTKVRLSSLAKRGLGVVSGVGDLASGGFGVFEEAVTGDYNAMGFHVATAVGGLVSIGGAIALYGAGGVATGVGAIPGAIALLIGGLLAMIGVIGAALSDDSPIVDWAKYCLWGNREISRRTDFISPSWAGGSLSELHLEPKRQVVALNNIVFALNVDCTFMETGIAVTINVNLVSEQSRIWLGVEAVGETRVRTEVRKFSPWGESEYMHVKDKKTGKEIPRYRGKVVMHELPFEVRLQVHVDIAGDGTLFHPQAPLETKFYRQPWSIAAGKLGL
jgi:hypothetical protein